MWMLLQEIIEFCLPKKIYKPFERRNWLDAVVIMLKMIDIKKFDVLQNLVVVN